MPLDPQDLRAAVEAIVYVSSEPVTVKALRSAFPHETEEALVTALGELGELYAAVGRGLTLERVAGGCRIATRPEVHAHVSRYVQLERAERLSLRTLETLSVVAYKQPVTAAEIGAIRGVDPGGTLKTLLDRGLIRIVGRKKVVGRPFVYGTTTTFLTTFSLNDLTELPSLKELSDLTTDLPTTDGTEVEAVEDEDQSLSSAEATEPSEGQGSERGGPETEAADSAAPGDDESPSAPRRRRGADPRSRVPADP